MKYCRDVIGGWAVGGEPFVYPDNMGLQWFGEVYDYIVGEFHYDNSQYKKNLTNDNSFMRLYVSPDIRPVQVGRLEMGTDTSNQAIVAPAKQEKFTVYGFCTAQCTKNYDEDIFILSGLLHMHLAGRKIRIRHIRNGTELEPVLADEHYDFNYQSPQIVFDNPRQIKPGDDLILECEIDTTLHDTTLLGGLSTHEEMCTTFLDYYPRHNQLSDSCYSRMDTGGFAQAMGVTAIYPTDDNPEDYPITDEDGHNDTYIHWASNFNWTRDGGKYIKAVQDATRYKDQVQWCTVTPNKTPPPEQWFVFTPLPSYTPRNDTDVYCLHKDDDDGTGGGSAAFMSSLFILVAVLQV